MALTKPQITLPPAMYSSAPALSVISPPAQPPARPLLQHSIGNNVEIATTLAAAAKYTDQWQALADRALDPNPFLEPWCMIPALDAYGDRRDTRFVFVYNDSGEKRRLIGVFPLEQRQKYRGVPFPHLVSWLHPQTFMAQPLVDPENAGLAWAKLLDWAKQQGAQLIEMPMVSGQSATMKALETTLTARCTKSLELANFERALFTPDAENSDAYIAQTSSAKSRKSWRRQNRRLGEQGHLERKALHPQDLADPWIDAFLSLEAESWKGREGTALASTPQEERFFRTMAHGAHDRQSLHMLGLFLDGRAIALQCNLFSGGDGFAFKVAFDEQFSALSPGVLLELAAIDDFFTRDTLGSVDSCTNAGHPLMGRLWQKRRKIDHILIPTGRLAGNVFLHMYPSVRALRARLQPKGKTS